MPTFLGVWSLGLFSLTFFSTSSKKREDLISNWLDGESLNTAWARRILSGAGLIVKSQNKKRSFLPPHTKIFISDFDLTQSPPPFPVFYCFFYLLSPFHVN